MYDLIVIGAGPGGYEAAAHAGGLGKKTLIIEEKEPGGICLHAGCIPTKTLLYSAKVLDNCRHAAAYGVECGEPGIDFSLMQQRKSTVVTRLLNGVKGLLKKNGVEIRRGHGCLLPGKRVSVDGEVMEAGHILIATGSRPAVPLLPGITGEAVLDSTALLGCEKIPDSLVIIGAGAIGLELAWLFQCLGSRVALIEMRGRIAPQMDGEISRYLKRALESRGIRIYLESRVTAIEGQEVKGRDARGDEICLSGEYILNATGRAPNLSGLGLDECGVETTQQGIVTDAQGRTNVDGIWACGDVTGRCLLAHAAAREGIVAVNNMFAGRETMEYQTVPAVIYTQPEAAGVGKREEDLLAEGRAYCKQTLPLSVSGRFNAEETTGRGYVKVLCGQDDKKILGVHMLGGPAGELISGAGVLLAEEMTTTECRSLVYPHPTVAEALKEALSRLPG